MSSETDAQAGMDTLDPQAAELVTSLITELEVPGVAVAVIDGDRVEAGCFGITNVEHPLTVDIDTLFQIGSITKTFTATALMRLVDAGTLDLDEPVRAYLPELQLQDAQAAAVLSTRHLLSHSAGFFGDHFFDTGPGDDSLRLWVETLPSLEQLTAPGSVWTGNNAGFSLAGRVLEVLTGQTYEAAVHDLVLAPLGMTRSYFFSSEIVGHRFASGHFMIDGHHAVVRPWCLPRSMNATGGLVTSVRDMVRYVSFHLGDGRAADGSVVLEPDTLELMQTPAVPGAMGIWRGLPWSIGEPDGIRILDHGGGGRRSGIRAKVALAPAQRKGMIVLTNSFPGRILHEAVQEWWTREIVGAAVAPSATGPRSSDELRPYVGTYRSPDTEIRIVEDGGHLGYLTLLEHSSRRLVSAYEQEPEQLAPARAALSATDRVVVVDGPTKGTRGEFRRDATGAVVSFFIDFRDHVRATA